MRTANTLIRLGGCPGSAQADLSLCWTHMPLYWFCHEVAQIVMQLLEKQNSRKNHGEDTVDLT